MRLPRLEASLIRPALRRGLALAVVASLLSSSAPARGDDAATSSSTASREASMPTEGKVVVYSFGGVTVIGLAVMSISLLARESAVSRHADFPGGGGAIVGLRKSAPT